MQLYISENTSDTLNYVLDQTSSKAPIICNGQTATQEELFTAHIIYQLEAFIIRQLDVSEDISSLVNKLFLKNPYVIIIYNPINKDVLSAKQTNSIHCHKLVSMYHELAKRAQKIVHMQSDIPLIIKDKPHTLLCAFIRHGKTLGNLSKRYIGTTNQPLCKEGILELKNLHSKEIYPASHLIYVSPLTRCIETAKILYPNQPLLSCEQLRECDFGEFENKNYKELQSHPYYQKWVDSNGQLPFPNGETPSLFTERCIKGFLACVHHTPYKNSYVHGLTAWTTFVVHGGTIMSILSELTNPKGDYFNFQVENGQGYLCEYNFDNQVLTVLDCIK